MKRKSGCLRLVLIILLAVFLLYFMVGNGKEKILKEIYPIRFQEYVEYYADEYNLDKYLVYSVIKVESNFDPHALSNANARGLMQLMSKTAEECNQKGEFGYTIPADLYNSQKNIHLGCFYLSSLMDTYKDTELAITAYNGGTGNVSKWLEDNKLTDGMGGLSDIPYTETKQYVKKVIKTYEMYNKLYKTDEI